MTFKTITHIECFCPDCKVGVKLPMDMISSERITCRSRIVCPVCGYSLPNLEQVIKTAIEYQHSVSMMKNFVGNGTAYFSMD